MIAHQQLLDLMQAALAAAPAVASGAIYRQRSRAVPADVPQAVGLRVVSSDCSPLMLGGEAPLEWRTVVAVECVARAVQPVTPDAAVADLVGAVHARIASDAAIRAAQYRIDPAYRLVWDQDDLDERIGAVSILYTVRHLGAIESIAA